VELYECVPTTLAEEETHLRSLDVVVEVVTEGLDVGNAVGAALWRQVTRKQDCFMSVVAKII
jgi:hypothetical protein